MTKTTGRFRYALGALAILALAACDERQENRTEGFLDDSVITAKVKSDLMQADDLNSMAIDVETTNQVVKLDGIVESSEQAEKAVMIANNVEGVKSVKNDLSVYAAQ